MKLHMSPAPHVHSAQTTRALMLNVILALLPCVIAGVYYFGAGALIVIASSVLSAVLGEALWQKLTGQRVLIGDLSAAVTGLILGLNLPSRAPWWIAAVGGLFAVIIVKGLFGGLGDNFINPALAARAVLLASWPKYMTVWAEPGAADAISGATPLANPGGYSLTQLFMGNVPGAIGETCKLAILIGLAILLLTKTITWHIPVAMVCSTFVFSFIFGQSPVNAVLSGGMLFAAVFMATDYVTCPMYPEGQLVYGCLIGLFIPLIRAFGGYPEGVTYAVLLMNAATPLIDHFTKHHVYGYEKEAKA